MKKILLLLFSFLFIMPFVNANSIERISMDIYLNEDGSAHVKEVWDTYSNDTFGVCLSSSATSKNASLVK